ncbi:MAG: SDR family NAD(P)-dependent oxidoreductase, partial [Acidimicrobiia bacterium]
MTPINSGSRIDFEDRVAIVTGAGGGLGRSHALLLASRGARVVVNDVGGSVDGAGASDGPAAKVVAEIEAAGGSAVADASSVATAEGGRAVVETALEAFGRID